MPRFVVQQHTQREGIHFDLMIERGGVLLTWRIPEPPTGPEHAATRIGDHRTDYLAYEGPVSNDRGSVRIWDAGELAIEEQADDHLLFTLNGRRMGGRYALLKEGDRWTLTRMPT